MPTSAAAEGQRAGGSGQGDRPSSWVSYAVPGLFVAAVLLLLIVGQGGAEAAAVQAVALLPAGYAFGAGMVASVNPCGFILLPSYVSYILGTEEPGYRETPAVERASRALLLGGAASAGFVAVFASAGLIVAAGGRWIAAGFPYAGLGIGVAMAGVGVWLLLSGRSIGIPTTGLVVAGRGRRLRHVFLFGIGYALGSLSCTLPIFLVVVGGALGSQGFVHAFSQFVAYALGMGTILVAVSLSAAFLRGAVARSLRGAVPHVYRASALFLLGAGAYLVYYWVFFARLFG